MKKLFILGLATSLLVNATLVYFLVRGETKVTPSSSAPAAPLHATAKPGAIDAKTWLSLKTDDLSALVARLREAGFPPDIVRAIVGSRLREGLDAQRKALTGEAASAPFWKNSQSKPGVQQALRQLERDYAKQLKSLVGEDDTGFNGVFRDRQLRGLPPDKVGDVRQVMREFDAKRSEFYLNGIATPAEREKITALEKEQRSAIAQLLTPEELLNYQLYTSDTANQLRSNLAAFNATEDEFRAIFKLTQPFDEQYSFRSMGGSLGQDQMRARSDAQNQLTEQIKQVLGTERAAEYVRDTDSNYRQTSQLVSRLELPVEATDQVWAVQQDVQQRMKDLNADRTLAPAQRTQALATLAEETKTKISATLGDRGYEAYRQYGGQWMQQMQSRQTMVRGEMRFLGP